MKLDREDYQAHLAAIEQRHLVVCGDVATLLDADPATVDELTDACEAICAVRLKLNEVTEEVCKLQGRVADDYERLFAAARMLTTQESPMI